MDQSSGPARDAGRTVRPYEGQSAGCGCLAGAFLGFGIAISLLSATDSAANRGLLAAIVVACAGGSAYLSRRYGDRFWAWLFAWLAWWW
jgi:hypothetical protein